MRPAVLLTLVLLVPGCFDGTATEQVDGPSVPLPAPPSQDPAAPTVGEPPGRRWVYACANDRAEERDGGACVARFADPVTSYQEPNIALHPDHPDTWAVGTNARSLAPADASQPAGPGAPLMHVEVLVTQDAGATFRAARLPVLPPYADDAAMLMVGDPSLAFDQAGRLHATALQVMGGPGGAQVADVYYTSSDDLGATWSPPVLLTMGGRTDRNWLTIDGDGILHAAWQKRSESRVFVARSYDRGATWPADAYVQVDGCVTASPVVFHGGRALVACVLTDRGGAGPPAVWEVPRQGPPVHVATGPGLGVFPHLAVAADGAILVALSSAEAEGGASLARASGIDGEWAAIDLADALDLDGWSDVRAIAFDDAGHAHVLAETGPAQCPRLACPSKSASGQRVVHAVLGPDLALLHMATVTPAAPSVPATAAPLALDDYHAVVFAKDRAVLAWSFDGAIELAALAPMPGWRRVAARSGSSPDRRPARPGPTTPAART